MTDKELAKRVAASPKWKWREDMVCRFDSGSTLAITRGLEEIDKWIKDGYPDLSHPATAGIVLSMCEDMARERGQTFVVICGIWAWQAEVYGPGQGKRAHTIHKDEPWNNPYSLGEVAGRLFLYLAEPLPEVTRGRVTTMTFTECSECGAHVSMDQLLRSRINKHAQPIECEHCGALLEVEGWA